MADETTATVDGVATEALPVMSQGELNAIALALFLPPGNDGGEPVAVRRTG